MKIVVLDYKLNTVAVLVLGIDNGKIYGLASSAIDSRTALALKLALKNKSLGHAIEIIKNEFPVVYKTAFRTFPLDTPIVQEYELT
jgi:hypothetical protein